MATEEVGRDVLNRLMAMTRELGEPQRDYVILSEGNTSALLDDGTYWVKASGEPLAKAGPGAFVRVQHSHVLALVDGLDLTEGEMRAELGAARVNADGAALPSIEAAMHAVCLSLEGVFFVGHTHPPAVNAILCSRRARSAFRRPLYPVETASWRSPLFVRHAPPGQPLARQLQRALEGYGRKHVEAPSAILLEGHGLAALGNTPQAVLDTTALVVKMARILVGTYALGGPRWVE